MKLRNEFTVSVPVERAWETLLDIETVASFLPGAKIEPSGGDGVFHGSMKVKVGPMVVNYEGTARLASADEQSHRAEIEVHAKEAKGQGTAAAVITNTLVQENNRTRVIAETDLQVTGRQAQFGRGIMQDVAGRMLGDFAGRLEAYLAGDGAVEAAPGGAGAPAAEPEEVLDLGAVLTQTPLVRYGVPIGVAVAALLLLLTLGRSRKRGLTVRVGFRL